MYIEVWACHKFNAESKDKSRFQFMHEKTKILLSCLLWTQFNTSCWSWSTGDPWKHDQLYPSYSIGGKKLMIGFPSHNKSIPHQSFALKWVIPPYNICLSLDRWCAVTSHHFKIIMTLFTLYTIKLVCIFSILFSTCFLSCWQGEFV